MTSPESPGPSRLSIERRPTTPGSGYYRMDSLRSTSGLGAVVKIEAEDHTGRKWKCEAIDDAAERVIAVITDVVVHEIAIADLQERLKDALNPPKNVRRPKK